MKGHGKTARFLATLPFALMVLALAPPLFSPPPAVAQEGELPFGLSGHAAQGGLLLGRVAPGTKLWLEGRPVRIGAEGHFLIGFARKAEPWARIEAVLPDGERVARTISVAQREYRIQRIDGLPESQVRPGPEDLERIRRESAAINAAREGRPDTALFKGAFAWPVKGRLTGVYGSQRILNGEARSPHIGVDIAADAGTPVRAPAQGVVVLVHDGMFFNGKTVMIDHGHGLTSVYAHMSAISVAEEERVARGDVIGAVGATGRATGPHLHWGAHLSGVGLDPALIAGEMPQADAEAASR